MEGFDDFVFEIAGKDESAVARKLLRKRPKEELYIVCCVIGFIDDDDFVSASCLK